MTPDEEETRRSRERLILEYVEDLVSDFLYYDRKEDEDLPRGVIENAVRERPHFSNDIVATFAENLRKYTGVTP